jgi:hypothetical protein
MNVGVTLPRGFRGFPLGFGGTDLVVIVLSKVFLDNNFTNIATFRSTTLDFLAPKLIGIVLNPLEWFYFKASIDSIQIL